MTGASGGIGQAIARRLEPVFTVIFGRVAAFAAAIGEAAKHL